MTITKTQNNNGYPNKRNCARSPLGKQKFRSCRVRASDPRATARLNPETPSERSEPRSLAHVGRFEVSEICRACFNASPPAACLHFLPKVNPHTKNPQNSESLSPNLLEVPQWT